MKKIILLIVMVALILIIAVFFSKYPSNKIDAESSLENALWIYSGSTYIDLESDGEFLSVIGNRYVQYYEVRSGTVEQELVDKTFRITNNPAVLNAKDTDNGESIFSQEEWVNVGILVSQNIKSTSPWGFTEELPDYPEEFQELVAELKSFSDSSTVDSDIIALVLAQEVDSTRTQRIKNDPRKFYDFVEIEEVVLEETPSLGKAIFQISRLIPISNEAEFKKINEYHSKSNLQSSGRDFFIIVSDHSYQVEILLTSPNTK